MERFLHVYLVTLSTKLDLYHVDCTQANVSFSESGELTCGWRCGTPPSDIMRNSKVQKEKEL